MLTPKVLLDTVLQGVQRGLQVGRLVRPDGSMRTWWREAVDAASRDDPQLEVVLPEQAELDALSAALLKPGVLDANAVLHPPPEPIAPQDLVEAAQPGAWSDGTTNGIALAQALSRSRGRTLPWGLVRDAIKASTASR